MQKYIFLILFFGLLNTTYSQINCNAGENVEYHIPNWLEFTENIDNIAFTVKSSNPTVFFIDSIKINDTILMQPKRNYNETKFSTGNLNSEQIDLIIYGTGLSGNDTITVLTIEDIFINDNKIDENEFENITVIQVKSNDNTIYHNYIRLAKITNLYPIPVAYGNDLIIYYVIDIPADVKFNVVNSLGASIEKFELKNVTVGKNEFKLKINNNYFSGIYWIILDTSSGKHRKSFVVSG